MSESAEIRDPVCGKTVDPLRARAVGIYGGVTHYFCSAECKAKFNDPRQPDAAAVPPPGGVERRWKDEEREGTGAWFEKGLASMSPQSSSSPSIEHFDDLDQAPRPMKEQPPSPSLLIELEGAKKKPAWPWVLIVLALGGAAVWFFGLRG